MMAVLLLLLMATGISGTDECVGNLLCTEAGQLCSDASPQNGDWFCACSAPLVGTRQGGVAVCKEPTSAPPPLPTSPPSSDDFDSTAKLALIVSGCALLGLCLVMAVVLICVKVRMTQKKARTVQKGAPAESNAGGSDALTARALAAVPTQPGGLQEAYEPLLDNRNVCTSSDDGSDSSDVGNNVNIDTLMKISRDVHHDPLEGLSDTDLDASVRVSTPVQGSRVCVACGRAGIMPWAERCPKCGSHFPKAMPSPGSTPRSLPRPPHTPQSQHSAREYLPGNRAFRERLSKSTHSAAVLQTPQLQPSDQQPLEREYVEV
eukprot:TRINITY_DN20688_c0_g1_i1.p1 TRINITY_DN20688_c0_g1~~TRINITY_DN20688_c0_g1_i1.p1  ORF type:complete len:345 (+),score=69.82 TRINITY_DN20688_c0_g1_i1:79-1035(+)